MPGAGARGRGKEARGKEAHWIAAVLSQPWSPVWWGSGRPRRACGSDGYGWRTVGVGGNGGSGMHGRWGWERQRPCGCDGASREGEGALAFPCPLPSVAGSCCRSATGGIHTPTFTAPVLA
eukprot:scaffold31285_cov107-Isochrysis_galbana.AAC.1